jgi:nucleoside-diphosphate-sugar epimerase
MGRLSRLSSPNHARIAYDFASTCLISVFIYLFSRYFLKESSPFLLLLPLVVTCMNGTLGVYNRYRTSSGILKGVLIAGSISLSLALLLLLNTPLDSAILCAVFVWTALALPRIFLNLNSKLDTSGFLKRTLNSNGPVLIVGGAGYIGTHVIDVLLESGHSVRVLDRLTYGKDPIQKYLSNPKFEFVEGDATDIMKLIPAMSGANAVIHLAGLVGDPACAVDEKFTRHVNVISTRIVKEMALSFGISRFIFASSCSVYGTNEKEVDELSELNPVSLYAKTKIDSEKELLLCPADDFNVTILRFATVFGHSQRPRFDLVANLFAAQAYVDGRITLMGAGQWRPFIHVRDLAKAVRCSLEADVEKVRGQIFNVGDSRLNTTVGDLALKVKNVVSKVRPVEIITLPSSDLRNYAVSFEKIREALGFESSVFLEQGIEEIISEFKKDTYQHYKDRSYSNLEMTKLALDSFNDPLQNARMYRPVSET